MSQAYKFLANYHLSKKSWVDAYKYAQVETSLTNTLFIIWTQRFFMKKTHFIQRCLNYVDGKTDGKMVLKEIAKIKAKEKEGMFFSYQLFFYTIQSAI